MIEAHSTHPDARNPNSPLHNFAKAWSGAGEARPPEQLHNETVALQRQQEKASNIVTVDFCAMWLDENRRLTLQQGKAPVQINAEKVQEFVAALVSLVAMPDPAVIDINTNPPNLASAPLTNHQQSVRDNEITANWHKANRR